VNSNRPPQPADEVDIAVIGIGNILMTDDGVGVHALNALAERYLFPPQVQLIDGGTMGLDLLPFVEGKKRVLFIDAANLEKDPGVIGELNNGEIPEFFSTKLSVHQIALPDMLAAGRFLGTLPGTLCLVGIQPGNTESGYGLTPAVQGEFEALLERVLAKLAEWGVKAAPKSEKKPG
jgi:hydrogenase maturation protease